MPGSSTLPAQTGMLRFFLTQALTVDPRPLTGYSCGPCVFGRNCLKEWFCSSIEFPLNANHEGESDELMAQRVTMPMPHLRAQVTLFGAFRTSKWMACHRYLRNFRVGTLFFFLRLGCQGMNLNLEEGETEPQPDPTLNHHGKYQRRV